MPGFSSKPLAVRSSAGLNNSMAPGWTLLTLTLRKKTPVPVSSKLLSAARTFCTAPGKLGWGAYRLAALWTSESDFLFSRHGRSPFLSGATRSSTKVSWYPFGEVVLCWIVRHLRESAKTHNILWGTNCVFAHQDAEIREILGLTVEPLRQVAGLRCAEAGPRGVRVERGIVLHLFELHCDSVSFDSSSL